MYYFGGKWSGVDVKWECWLCIQKFLLLSEDPYEKKLVQLSTKKIRKEGEDVYDGIATSLGMWDKMEYDATREYLCQNGGFTPVAVSIDYASCRHHVSIVWAS